MKTDKLDYVAFKNPDGRLVTIILNRQEEDLEVYLRLDGKHTKINVAKKSLERW